MATSGIHQGKVVNCCRCNRNGTCKKCSCTKAGRHCMKCLPGTLGNCLNPQPPGVNAGQPFQPPPPSLAFSASSADPMTPASTSTAQPWPPIANWSSIFSSRSSTLHHVPKGARDACAGLVYDVFSNINRDPSVTEGWLKLFMLPHCILVNPTNGAHQPWRETLKVVRA